MKILDFLKQVEEQFGFSRVDIVVDTKDNRTYELAMKEYLDNSPYVLPTSLYNPTLPLTFQAGLVKITIRRKTEPITFKIGNNIYELSEIQQDKFLIHGPIPPIPDMVAYKGLVSPSSGEDAIYSWTYDALRFNGKRYSLKLLETEVLEATSMSGVKMKYNG